MIGMQKGSNMKISRALLSIIMLACSLNIKSGFLPKLSRSHGKLILTTSLLVMSGRYYLSARKKEVAQQQPTPAPKENIDDQKREERFRAYLGFDRGWVEPHPQTHLVGFFR
jgi:hypothetical protein